MRAFQVAHLGNQASLIEGNVPVPHPGPGDLLIRVQAAGVTPTELLWYPTSHTQTGEDRAGAIPAHEFSGVITEVGNNAGSFAIGQEVFGMNDWFAEGALAEYCIAPFTSVVAKPPSLTHDEAASVPIGALTAWQGLFDRAKLQPGERVLVQGGAGAVGIFAIQLAKYKGAHVITTVSTDNREFVTSMGAAEVIDYRHARFEDLVHGVDVVFDTVGGETLDRSWRVLQPNGRLVTIAAGEERSADSRVKNAFFIVEPNQQQLLEISDLLVTGRLRPVVSCVVPFGLAPAAYAGGVAKRGPGKLVVSVAA